MTRSIETPEFLELLQEYAAANRHDEPIAEAAIIIHIDIKIADALECAAKIAERIQAHDMGRIIAAEIRKEITK